MSIAVYPVVFTLTDVPASQTNLSLTTPNGAHRQIIPWDGEVVAVAINSSAVRTGGSCTAKPQLTAGGVLNAAFHPALDASNTLDEVILVPHGSVEVEAGDRVECKLDTTAAWTPITADITVTIWVSIGRYEVG